MMHLFHRWTYLGDRRRCRCGREQERVGAGDPAFGTPGGWFDVA